MHYRKRMSELHSDPSQFEALHGEYFKFSNNNIDKTLTVSLNRATGVWDETRRHIGLLFGCASKIFSAKGVYYIQIPKHSVVYINDGGNGYFFVDANSGEWHCNSATDMDSFLFDYYKQVYYQSSLDGEIQLSIFYAT